MGAHNVISALVIVSNVRALGNSDAKPFVANACSLQAYIGELSAIMRGCVCFRWSVMRDRPYKRSPRHPQRSIRFLPKEARSYYRYFARCADVVLQLQRRALTLCCVRPGTIYGVLSTALRSALADVCVLYHGCTLRAICMYLSIRTSATAY
jgi:hypothetical protein